MKKASLYIASIAAGLLSLTACQDDPTDGGVMQQNPQLPEIVAGNFVVSPAGATTYETLNLEDLKDAETLTVLTSYYNTDSVLPADAVVDFEMQISGSEDFADARTISLINSGDNIGYSVDIQLWDNAFRSLFGKAPSARTNYLRFAGYVTIGNQRNRIGNLDTWFAPTKIEVTPIDLGIKVEEAYYLVGTVNGWDLATAVKFSHNSDKNVYDDPVFTLSIDVTADQAEGGWWWKIVPESAFAAQSWDGLYGVEIDGDTSASGNLYAGGNAGQLKTPGQQLFTINMLSCTYTVTNAVPQLYTPGNSNNWTIDASSILTTTDYTNYSGFLYLNGEWLMTPAANWDNKYALGAGPGTLAFNGSSNLPMPEQGAGLYWTVANLGSLTYVTNPITVIGLIGDFNGWAGDVEMTPSADMLTWTAELTVEEGQGWKFRCNNDWAINLGGSIDNLVPNGDNITCPAGTYTVTLNLAHQPYTATLTAK